MPLHHVIHRNNAPWAPVAKAAPQWEQGALRSSAFNDIYFSVEDGLAESRYVFIEGSGLVERIRALTPGDTLTLCELGLGTGLNFLLTLQAWHATAPKGACLHYIGIDAQPIDANALGVILEQWPELADEAAELLAVWPDALPGCHRRQLSDGQVRLDCWWEPAEAALADLASHGQALIDGWFLDGFAPALNPDMWTEDLWRHMATLSHPEASVATFTAAGDVRRGLMAAGFTMEKRPGFGRKRESLTGRFNNTTADHAPPVTPWDWVAPASSKCVTVLGAGLAGAHVAYSLARRGFAVTVLEADDIACGGSSNRQGVTYTRLSRRFGVLSDFAIASYQYSLVHYRQLFASGALRRGSDGDFCGYLQLSEDSDTLTHLSEVLRTHPEFAQIVDVREAKALTGIETASGGIWYPQAAWLYPGAVCNALLEHPNIEVTTKLGPLDVNREVPGEGPGEGKWLIQDQQQQTISRSELVVVATASNTVHVPELDWLPLQVIRGQTTHIESAAPLSELRSVICHKGYLPPAVNNQHCIGASFGPNDPSLDEREDDHLHNLSQLREAIPALSNDPKRAGGRVALRCNSSDYLPVAGPAVDSQQFATTYSALRTRSKTIVNTRPPLHSGLWCLAGLGSRGLTAAPLAAETIASQMCGEPAPLPRYLQRALSPARFLERRLKRGEL